VRNLSRIRIVGTTVLVACLSSTGHAETGGISGGGGGTTTPPGVEVGQIAEAARNSKTLLQAWLNQKHLLFQFSNRRHPENPKDPVDVMLFEQNPNVFDLISRLNIEVRNNRACHTSDGEEVDGSIFAEVPGAICISAFRLASKLNSMNYEPETLGLILHEVMHLLGSRESEAISIQKHAIEILRRYSLSDEVDRLKQKVTYRISDTAGRISDIRKSGDHSGTCEMTARAIDKYIDLYGFIPDDRIQLSPLSFSTSARLYDSGVKLYALHDYLCAHDPLIELPRRQSFMDVYDRSFGGKAVISSEEYWRNKYPGRPWSKDWNLIQLRKISSAADLDLEIQDLEHLFRVMQQELSAIAAAQFNVVEK